MNIFNIPAEQLELLHEYFYSEDGLKPFSYSLYGPGEDLVWIDFDFKLKNNYEQLLAKTSKIATFINRNNLTQYELLIYAIVSLGSSSNLEEKSDTTASTISLENKRDHQKKVEEYYSKGISKFLDLKDEANKYLTQDVNARNLKSITFKFEDQETGDIKLTTDFEINLMQNIFKEFFDNLDKRAHDLESYSKAQLGIQQYGQYTNAQKRLYRFCYCFVELMKKEITPIAAYDQLFQMFYDLYLLCGYVPKLIHSTGDPKKTVRNWCERGKPTT